MTPYYVNNQRPYPCSHCRRSMPPGKLRHADSGNGNWLCTGDEYENCLRIGLELIEAI